MTAKEKFEARLEEFGLLKEWQASGDEHIGKVLEDGRIVVFTHYCNDDDPYTEDIFPSFEDLRNNEKFRQECWDEYYCHADDKFVADLACWLTGKEIGCPLFPVDVYLPANGLEISSKIFEDDVNVIDLELDKEEDQIGIDEARGKLDLMVRQISLFRKELVAMIRIEYSRGHNLYSDFDPYPGWDSHHLYAYTIEGKTIKVVERVNGLCLALYQDGYETEYIPLEVTDFPIEVLFNIYCQMK